MDGFGEGLRRLAGRSVRRFGLAAALSTIGLAAAAQTPVDVELVLAVDISGSVDLEEGRLQRQGYIDAIAHPQVVDAITSGPMGRIAVCYVEWSGDAQQYVVVPWRVIDGPATAEAFSDLLAEAPVGSGRYTSISGAIDFSVPLFESNAFEGLRRVIDVSGDGVNNRGRLVTMARDAAVAAGVTINGLPIINDRPNPFGTYTPKDLDAYYEREVIGGPGAFVMVAESFQTFGSAILAKLLREIAATPPEPGSRPTRRQTAESAR
ncbi:DUF1194 domain-containing protein [Arenibaculum pallidiluteum]|uniref:DUF1194 domain-containing protein n=1 Tax=Arenibaculum pallidiluteum TaxID=2812559 RepID=UPI001A97CAD5|nr:DUF1194 domain-containing protein [Arenibaculum pallidiluteum]